jgi:transglutaminase-like putative cysteine protease
MAVAAATATAAAVAVAVDRTMRLQVHHRTEYLYLRPVSNSSNQLRLTPINSPTQRCESNYISVMPASRLGHYDDLNANRVHYFEINRPHSRLVIDSRATVTTQSSSYIDKLPIGCQHSELEQCKGLEACRPYLQNSHYVELSPLAWREAIDIKQDCVDVFQTCTAIMAYIFNNYAYDSEATVVSTHANQVLENRAGVCQDFAHAMLAMCRTIQIPARYISGYFFDSTREQSLRGSAATHAWVEAYIPSIGWFGLDPTNNKFVDETYIMLAAGRDYLDVAPVAGSYYGNTASALTIRVQIDRIS